MNLRHVSAIPLGGLERHPNHELETANDLSNKLEASTKRARVAKIVRNTFILIGVSSIAIGMVSELAKDRADQQTGSELTSAIETGDFAGLETEAGLAISAVGAGLAEERRGRYGRQAKRAVADLRIVFANSGVTEPSELQQHPFNPGRQPLE